MLFAMLPALAIAQPAEKLYQQHCAGCHGAERLGAMGPALLPENLERLRRAGAVKVIADGLLATQMPGYGGKLTAAEIDALLNYIYTPPAVCRYSSPARRSPPPRASRHRPASASQRVRRR